MDKLFEKLNQHFNYNEPKKDLKIFNELEDIYNINIPLSIKEYYANYYESNVFNSFAKFSKTSDLIGRPLLGTNVLNLGETLDSTINIEYRPFSQRIEFYKKSDEINLDELYDKNVDCFMIFAAAYGLVYNSPHKTSIKLPFSTYKELIKMKKLEKFFQDKRIKPYFLNVLIVKDTLCTYQVSTQSLTIGSRTKTELNEIKKFLGVVEKPEFTTDTPFSELSKFAKLETNKITECEINEIEKKLKFSLPSGLKSFYRYFENLENIRNSQFMFDSIYDIYIENDFLIFGTFSQGIGKYGVKLSELNNNIECVHRFDEDTNQWNYETALNTESFLLNAISVNLINEYPVMAEADISEEDLYSFIKEEKIQNFVDNFAFNRSYYNISTYKHKKILICYIHTINKAYFGAMSETAIYKLEKILDISIGIL